MLRRSLERKSARYLVSLIISRLVHVSQVTFMADDNWSIVVVSCKSEIVENSLVSFYNFVKDLEAVKDINFLIRDRLDDEVIFCFHALIDQEHQKVAESKMVYKLKTLLSEEKFSLNPQNNDPLAKYVAWSPTGRTEKYGAEKFNLFCSYLSTLSELVVDMAQNKYFDSSERVEITRLMSSMLGCTEYGSLSAKQMEIGYYDRISNKYQICLKEDFAEQNNLTHA